MCLEILKYLFIVCRNCKTQKICILYRLIPPDEKEWAELLSDMLDIHGLIFTCIGVETCFEICVSARLVSGIKLTIQNCASLIETKRNEKSLVKVSYEKAIDLILEATKEYFNGSKTFTDPNMELAKSVVYLNDVLILTRISTNIFT